MQKLTHMIISHRKAVIAVFTVLTVICALLSLTVEVNYHLADYLPDNAESTVALNTMYEQFDAATPNLRVYIPDVSIPEALEYKQALLDTPGVIGVMWLDDSIDIRQPLEMADPGTVEGFYKDGGALYQVTVGDELNQMDSIKAVRETVGDDAAISGDVADSAAAQMTVVTEVGKAVLLLAPIILVILILTTNSWLEPILFIIVIIVSIVLNYGTNKLMGEISFLTQSIAPVLQLAVSMDYVIFLLSTFNRNRQAGQDAETAMENAVQKMASTVIASAATTFAGFIVLVFMDFKIGPDLGIVLAKGIFISVITAIVLLPAVTMSMLKALDKTAHRSFMPSFKKFGTFTSKLKIPALMLVIVLLIPAYLAQSNLDFTYGTEGMNEGSQLGEDTDLINSVFGKNAFMVLMVPKGDFESEAALCSDIKKLDKITSVNSYSETVGSAIPSDFLDESESSQLLSDLYSRIIITANVSDEGDEAFALVEKVREISASYYGADYHLCGTNVNNYDMRTTVIRDNALVSTLALISVGLIILLTFKSLSLPFILLLTIQSAIWINLGLIYFSDTKLPYLAYLVVNTVQLGATIDYAILFTEYFMDFRKSMAKGPALMKSSELAAPSVLAPAIILASAGYALGASSTNGIIKGFGSVLCRGTLMSAALALILLPGLLFIFDKVIGKTTLKCNFYSQTKEVNNEK